MKTTRQVRGLSKLMICFCWVGIVAYPTFQIWFWLFNPSKFQSLPVANFLSGTNLAAVSNAQIALALAVSLIGALLIGYALYRLANMFKEFIAGNFFAAKTIRHLYVFTLLLLISVIYKIIQTGLLAAVLSWHNPPGQRQLVLNFGSQEISTLFIVGVLLAVTWCFRKAHQIETENKEFI